MHSYIQNDTEFLYDLRATYTGPTGKSDLKKGAAMYQMHIGHP